MKRIIIILLFAGQLFAQDKVLTLSESIELGLQNSRELKITRSKIRFAEAKESEIASQFLPQFSFYGSYTRLSNNIPPFEVSIPFSPTPFRISEPILDNYTFKLGFTQALFTGRRLSSLRNSAEYNFKAAESEHSKSENEAAFNINVAYWNYYKAEEIKKLIEQTFNQTESHLKDTRNFYENGLVSKNDLLKLEVQYSNIKLMLIEAKNNLDLARIAFNKAIGIALNTKTKVAATEKFIFCEEHNPEEIIDEATKNRNEIKELTYKSESTQEGIKAAKADWLPALYLSGNYYYSNPNPRFQPAKNEFNNNWDLGVTLKWDVWNWGLTSSKVSQAEQTKIQLETNLEQLKENIKLEVYSNYLNLLSVEEKIKVNREALNQAAENYRITVEKYDLQLATSTDLIDAETARLQAETNIKTTEVDYRIAKAKLEKSLGRRIY